MGVESDFDVLMYDVVGAVCWFLSTLVLGWTAWQWAGLIFRGEYLFAKICHALVLCWGTIVLAAFLLSLANLLSGHALLALVTLMAVLALFGRRKYRQATSEQALVWIKSERLWLVPWGILWALWVGHIVVNGICRFPTDWDSLSYHIPLIDHWLQAASLYAPHSGRWTAPGNNGILGLWFVGPFSGDFFIHLNNAVPAMLLVCSSVEFSSYCGLPRPWAHLFGFLSVSHYVILKQLVDAENDLSVLAFFFASLFYVMRYYREKRGADLLLAGVSLGLLLGIKFYASGYAFVALFVLAFLSSFDGVWSAAKTITVALLGLLVFGGYWYIRNYVVTGSPFFPKEFFKESDLLREIYPAVGESSFWGNGRPELLGLFISAIWANTGFCHLAGFVLVPFTLCGLVGFGVYQRMRKDYFSAMSRFVVAFVLVATGCLLAVTPFAVEDQSGTLNQMHWQYCPVRYGLCFLSTATLAAIFLVCDVCNLLMGWFGQRANSWAGRLAGSVGLLVWAGLAVGGLLQVFRAAGQLFQSMPDTILLAVNLALGCVAILLVASWTSPAIVLKRGCVVAGLALWTWASICLSQSWHQGFAEYYDAILGSGFQRVLTRVEPGSRVCTLTVRNYPFFGSYRQFSVYQPLFVYSSEWLMQYLVDNEVKYIAVQSHNQKRRLQGIEKCYEEHPGVFESIAAGDVTVFCFCSEQVKKSAK